MTPAEAADLAARALAAIDAGLDAWGRPWQWLAADRERVASDLAGLQDHADGFPYCAACEVGDAWPCPDAARYADGLRRTAALYGVTA